MTPLSGYPTGIGDYEIRGVLGSGASGTVYLAYQEFMDRRVALKELSAELTADPIFRERFRAEAEVMARLDDDNCVRVFDYLQRDKHDYLVTELVDGASLRKLVQNSGRLTPEEALGVVKGSLLGLAHAHDLGLLHRDIKPENVLVDGEGTSKLADFGLAISQPGPGAAGGMPAGSPAYMSPEMVAGGDLDARSDLYSVGAVMFELLTGRPPFVADNPLAVMRMQREAPVPNPRDLNPELGPGMTQLLQQALAKDPSERPRDAAEMLRMLETRAAEAYGADWESRASLKRKVAATIGAGLGLLAMLGSATALAGAGAVGTAVVAQSALAASGGAAAAGGVLGASTWAVAAAVAGVLVLGGGAAYALTRGPSSPSSPVAAAISSPSPSALASPSPVVSPSPSPEASPVASPSPSPSPSPSARPSPTQSPTKAPTPPSAPPPPSVVVGGLAMGWELCDASGASCAAPYGDSTPYYVGSGPSGEKVIACGTQTVRLFEQYNYSAGGSTARPVNITVHWNGVYNAPPPPASTNNQDQVVRGSAGTHAYAASVGYLLNPPQPGVNAETVTVTLSWTNPDGTTGTAPTPGTFHLACG